MTPREAAEYKVCGVSTIRRWIREGLLKADTIDCEIVASGFIYNISKRDLDKVPDQPTGFPRGRKR